MNVVWAQINAFSGILINSYLILVGKTSSLNCAAQHCNFQSYNPIDKWRLTVIMFSGKAVGKTACGLPVVKSCSGTACVTIRATILRVFINTAIDISTEMVGGGSTVRENVRIDTFMIYGSTDY